MKNSSLMLCFSCSFLITVLVFGAPSLQPERAFPVACILCAPLALPFLFSFWMHTRTAHWLNAGPALLYTAFIAAVFAEKDGGLLVFFWILRMGPIAIILIVTSWIAAWALRNPRDPELG